MHLSLLIHRQVATAIPSRCLARTSGKHYLDLLEMQARKIRANSNTVDVTAASASWIHPDGWRLQHESTWKFVLRTPYSAHLTSML